MAYTKTAWVNGSAPAISAANLNKIEDGVFDANRKADDVGISVKNFGAVGDGVTDDTNAVLSALQSGDAYFPAGTYLLSTWSVTDLGASRRITGAGRERVTVKGPDLATNFLALLNTVRISGVTFDTWAWVLDVRALTSEIRIELRECGSSNVGRIINRNGTYINTVAIRGLEIHDCYFDSSAITDYQVFISATGNVWDANITRNTFLGIPGTAVNLGTEHASADENKMGNYVVSNNIFRDIVGPVGAAETHAVIAWGNRVTITGNVVENVSGEGQPEAIYTKCRHVTITGNSITDGSGHEGAINVKGGNRGTPAGSPLGYAVVVSGNVINFTSAIATPGVGIRASSEDVLIANNFIFGAGNGIEIGTVGIKNMSIENNQIRNSRKESIVVGGGGDRLRISRNRISSQISDQSATVSPAGINVTPGGAITQLEISGNEIFLDGGLSTAVATSSRGINITRSQVMNNVVIRHNVINVTHGTLSTRGISIGNTTAIDNWRVFENDCSQIVGSDQFAISMTNVTDLIAWGNDDARRPIDDNSTSTNELLSGKVFSNATASAIRTFTLPPAVPGLEYTFIRIASFAYRIDPSGADIIRSSGGGGKYLQLDANGDNVTLKCATSGVWEKVAGVGTYSYEP